MSLPLLQKMIFSNPAILWWKRNLVYEFWNHSSYVLWGMLQDSEDSLPQLTPEQQKQLEIIDKMPLCKETEISHEEWDSKTPDEREQIMGWYFFLADISHAIFFSLSGLSTSIISSPVVSLDFS